MFTKSRESDERRRALETSLLNFLEEEGLAASMPLPEPPALADSAAG